MHDYDDGDDEILEKNRFYFWVKILANALELKKRKEKKKSVKMPVIIGSD